jgi:hypothetical protein
MSGDESPPPPTVNSGPRITHPKLEEGFKVIEAEPLLIVEVKETPQSSGVDVTFGLQVAIFPDTGEVTEVHVELTKETDIYYVARCTLDTRSFEGFKQQQRLKKSSLLGDFVDSTLKKTLSSVMSNRTTFKAIFESEKLLFRQQLEFKNVKIFELEFVVLDKEDPYVKDQAQYRYNRVQRLIRSQDAKLVDLYAHIEQQDKGLSQQFKRSSKLAQTPK